MLVPHGRANTQLRHAGFAAQQFEEALIFIGLEAVLLDDVGGDFGGRGFCHVAGGLAPVQGIHNHDLGRQRRSFQNGCPQKMHCSLWGQKSIRAGYGAGDQAAIAVAYLLARPKCFGASRRTILSMRTRNAMFASFSAWTSSGDGSDFLNNDLNMASYPLLSVAVASTLWFT